MQVVGIGGEVEERLGAVVDWDGKGMFWCSSVIHTDENCLSLLHGNSGPVSIVSCIAEAEAAAMEVDDEGKSVG